MLSGSSYLFAGWAMVADDILRILLHIGIEYGCLSILCIRDYFSPFQSHICKRSPLFGEVVDDL